MYHKKFFIQIQNKQIKSQIKIQKQQRLKAMNFHLAFKISSPALTYKEITVKNQDIYGKCTISLC